MAKLSVYCDVTRCSKVRYSLV